MTKKASIMIVEDEFVVSHDLAVSLTDLGYTVCAQVDSGTGAIQQAGQHHPDLILMDIRLKGEMDGIQAAACIHQLYRMPVIFLTAHADQELLKRAKIAEPFGYLLKPFTKADLYTALEVGLYKARLESRLRRSEDRFKQMADQLPTVICELNRDYQVQFINRAGLQLLGLGPDDFRRGIDLRRHLQHAEGADDPFREALLGLASGPSEKVVLKKDGSPITVIARCAPIHEENRIVGVRASLTDISELKHSQEQLSHVHRMETVGTLAGGIAHEFNNALTTIMTGIELLRMHSGDLAKTQRYLDNMQAVSDRMAHLIRLLLAYAGQGQWRIATMPLSHFVATALERAVSIDDRQIELTTELQVDGPPVALDEAQFQMIIAALVANAVEAIQGKGRITISTGEARLEANDVQSMAGLRPGHYAWLTVEDNGRGMQESVRRRIFEPFFSTKFQGRGLGMASVYGIVKNHGGWIGVDSHSGRGTRVIIYFPAQADS